jgi:hypothetical protein
MLLWVHSGDIVASIDLGQQIEPILRNRPEQDPKSESSGPSCVARDLAAPG